MPTEIPVHDRTVPVSCYPHERGRSAASARSLDYTGVQVRTTTTEKGRGALRGTKESQSHRPPSAPAAQVEVRTRAVLPGGHCPEHQTSGPVPQPANDVTGTCHCLGSGKGGYPSLPMHASAPEHRKRHRLFQHPPLLSPTNHSWAVIWQPFEPISQKTSFRRTLACQSTALQIGCTGNTRMKVCIAYGRWWHDPPPRRGRGAHRKDKSGAIFDLRVPEPGVGKIDSVERD